MVTEDAFGSPDQIDADVLLKIPPEVRHALGWYVYLYLDPRPTPNTPLYVGKGIGDRATAHLGDKGQTKKAQVLQEIRDACRAPRIDIVARNLNEKEAFRVEAALIDTLQELHGDQLLNKVRGYGSAEHGRLRLQQAIDLYSAQPVKIQEEDRVILIRINRLFKYGMSETDLYQSTRRAWKVGKRRELATFACPVFQGVIQEVYTISEWHPDVLETKRWEFSARISDEPTREHYKGRQVRCYFRAGQQSPIAYVNC